MKILFIIPIFFEENEIKSFYTLGGGERYPFELARFLALNNPKDEISIVIFSNRSFTYSQEGIKINVIKGLRVRLNKNSNYSPIPFSARLLKLISNSDVVHCFHLKSDTTLLSSLVSLAYRKPLFITDLGGGAKWSLSRIVDVQNWITSALCLSEFDKRFWKTKKTKVIYGGVDISKYPYKKKKRNYILFVGRILPHKGVDLIIKALSNSQRLIIAGRTGDEEYLKHLKSLSKNKNVEFITNPSDKTLIDLYQNAACFVLPSTFTDYKGRKHNKSELLGLVVIEALACGTPVIVSSTASLPELIQEGVSGYIFKDGDYNDLRNKIKLIFQDKNKLDKMSLQARKTVEDKFDWKIIAKNVREIYSEYTNTI